MLYLNNKNKGTDISEPA